MQQNFNVIQQFVPLTFQNNIAATGQLNPAISFRRPSTASYFDVDGVLKWAEPNVPCIEWDHNGNCLGLKIEPNSTNNITDSEFANTIGSSSTSDRWYLSGGQSIAASDVVAPDAVTKAKLLNPSADNVGELTYIFPGRNAHMQHNSFSLFVKQKSGSGIRVTLRDTSQLELANVVFNASGSGSITAKSFHRDTYIAKATIEHCSSGWYRVWVVVVSKLSFTEKLVVSVAPAVTTSSFYLWGAQLEEIPYITSYIRTNGAKVTRARMSVNILAGDLNKYTNGSEFTIVTNFRPRSIASSNHITAGPSFFTDSNNRCRILVHAPYYTGLKVMLSGRLDGRTETSNALLSSNVDYDAWYALEDFRIAISSKPGQKAMMAAMGKTSIAYLFSGEILVNDNTYLSIGHINDQQSSSKVNETGEMFASGHLKELYISDVAASARVLRAMTEQNISEDEYAKFRFVKPIE